MKKRYPLTLLLMVFSLGFFLSRQTPPIHSQPSTLRVGPATSSRAVTFAESQPLTVLREASERLSRSQTPVRETGLTAPSLLAPSGIHDTDGSLATFGSTQMPDPLISFSGLSDEDNTVIHSLFIMPADMNGDVGPNHYVQTVNSLLRVYDKTGSPLSDRLKLSSLFQPLGTACSTRDDGLPIVQYDSLADRWLISQTCVAFPPFRQMVAISKTGNPLGAYHLYEFVMPGVRLNDFPKFGVWPDGYYMSTEEYLGSDYVGAGVFAFDREKLLAGDPAASYIYFNLPVPVSPRRRGYLPSDLDGLRPPLPGTPNVFASYTATEYGDAQDSIRLFDFHADFASPSNSSFGERPESPIAVAAFDPTSPDGRTDILQPPPGEPLDSSSDRLNYRLAYRNFGSYESLVVNQTVRTTPPASNYNAGVRVYEFRKNGATYAVAEQSTLGTSDSSRWVAGVAQDHQGNLAAQYNSGSSEKKPSIVYTGKLATDPPGQFRAEHSFVIGTGVQKAFGWRWGEYSGMNVDPVDDCTFWMTNAYYTAASEEFSDFGWVTQIGSFKFAECTPAPSGAIVGVVTNASNGQPVPGVTVRAYPYSRVTAADGTYGSMRVLPGSYQVTASARGFLPASVNVTVANGEVLNRDFALIPVPVFENPTAQISSESCAINGAPEPGERVTYDVTLQNTGVTGGAADLTASIVASSGVVDPGPAQSYGSLPVNGPPITRQFSFRIAPSVLCGGTVTLTLELRDGGSVIGTLSIPIQTGALRVAYSNSFDGVTAPALPADWSTSSSENHQLWRTSASRSESAPNSLFSPAPLQMGVNEGVSPEFAIFSSEAEIRFRHWYELETTFLRNRLYDGAVLEIKLGNDEWQDILAAGGVFLSGGYDGTIDSCCQNPLAGRLGWSGKSGVNQTSEWITTSARLPASAAGQAVRLRFRVGTDIGSFREGQYIDDLVVSDGYVCQCQPGGRAPFDFDGDQKTDVSVFELNSGSEPDFRVIASSTNNEIPAIWGATDDLPANADFDGDGKTDFAVFRPSDGNWYILRSSDGGFVAFPFGLPSDQLVPGDYDGDGKDDVAVFRPSNGYWYIFRSLDHQVTFYPFGQLEDKPVNNDFDGDGKVDVAVWRPSDGTWYIARSSGGLDIGPFGLSTDVPVSGDYDGDGRADIAVYRPSTGVWYLFRSTAGFAAARFGAAEDLPLQADFDGDGLADIAVFRPSSKAWYHLRSSDGNFSALQFGSVSESPVPAIYTNR